MEILFVRHGQTDWNVKEKLQSRKDIELNQTGIKQAEYLQDILKDENIDLIICSPLKRATKTAAIINNRNIPIIYDERLQERNFGILEGKTNAEINNDEFWSYKKNIKYPQAETMHELFTRIYSFLDDIKTKYNYHKILIVSHGGVSIPFKCYFNGIEDKDTLRDYIIDNCEVLRYNIKK